MMNRPINPFIAIFLISLIGVTATFFVLRQISRADFIYASYTEETLP
jgi:hypothetical protein